MSSTSRTAEDAFQDVLLGLFQLHGHVLNAADVMSGDLDLTGARWQVLKVVARQPMTVSQVARRLGLQRQSVQRTVDHMRGQGLVEILPNQDHLRAGLVAPSVEGRRILALLQERQQAWLGRCLRGMSRAELDGLAAALADMAARVERATARERTDPADDTPARRRGLTGIRRRLTAA
jgi:DNA-binding MarR family transcriptional regulator